MAVLRELRGYESDPDDNSILGARAAKTEGAVRQFDSWHRARPTHVLQSTLQRSSGVKLNDLFSIAVDTATLTLQRSR